MSVNLLALAAATAVLVSIPGPNVALIVATSLRSGLRAGFTTVFGTTLGVAIQLLVVAIGLAAIVELAANVLAWLRWAGVAYLVWLGIATWRAPVRDGVGTARARASRAIPQPVDGRVPGGGRGRSRAVEARRGRPQNGLTSRTQFCPGFCQPSLTIGREARSS